VKSKKAKVKSRKEDVEAERKNEYNIKIESDGI